MAGLSGRSVEDGCLNGTLIVTIREQLATCTLAITLVPKLFNRLYWKLSRRISCLIYRTSIVLYVQYIVYHCIYKVRVNVSKDPPLQNILTGAMQMIIFNLSEKVKDKFFNILIEVTHGFGWSLNYRSPWMFKSYSPGHREVDR